MQGIRHLVQRYPITTFIVIAFAWTYAFTLLGAISLAFSLLALFGPALAAMAVAAVEGSFRALWARITDGRQHIAWYLLALAIPFAVAGVARVILTLAGSGLDGIGEVSPVEMVIFVLVIGEEIGWRSFLQPRLRTRMGLGIAGLVTGVVWTLWHLPIYFQPDQGLALFGAFAAWVIPLGVVMGIFSEATRFSAILATVMHGAANIATPLVLPDVDRVTWLVLGGAVYATGAVVYLVLRRSQARLSVDPVAHGQA